MNELKKAICFVPTDTLSFCSLDANFMALPIIMLSGLGAEY